MATNFRISVRTHQQTVRLRLSGDFDGSSAHELIKTLARNTPKTRRIEVNTDGLRHVSPYGCSVFEAHLNLPPHCLEQVVFTGDKAGDIAPDGSRIA